MRRDPVLQLRFQLGDRLADEAHSMLFELSSEVRLDGVEEKTQIDQRSIEAVNDRTKANHSSLDLYNRPSECVLSLGEFGAESAGQLTN